MGTGIDSLLDISKRALFAQTQAIRVIGSNIANANTAGYSRRTAELVTTQPTSSAGLGEAGTGVEVAEIQRVVDTYLTNQEMGQISETSKFDIRNEILKRAESPFSLDSTAGHIGTDLSNFFSSLQDLAANPSSVPLRTSVIQSGQTLAQSIKNGFDQVASLQRETDDRISTEIDDVNRLTSQIADLNSQIAGSENGNGEALTLRDQREELMRQLSKLVSFDTVKTDDGAVLITLKNGFGLVTGSTARKLECTKAPTLGNPNPVFPSGLDGDALNHIVFDFDATKAGVSDVDLTSIFAAGGGEIAGLLTLRGIQTDSDITPYDAQGDLVTLGARVESIARDLLTRFNNSYRGPDEDSGTAGLQPSSGDLNNNSPGLFGLFTFVGANAGFDADNSGTIDGTELATANNAQNYATQIQFGFDDPRELAAALDLNPVAGAKSFAPGDSANLDRLLAERDNTVTYSLGSSLNETTTIEGLYNSTVSTAGRLASQASNDFNVAKDRESQVQELRASVSGVSLDEEFANLINFQRAFEASGRIVKVGDELMQQILQLLG